MECVSYNKDFLVDKVIKETKFKDDRGIKGKVLVEIFDAKTNKKVKEAYTENIIPDLFFKDMFLRHFAGGIMGINTRSQDQFNNNFECIYLTDSTKPESANTEKVTGNIIGYAYRNTEYSGTDTLRGTINKLESKMEIVNGKIRTTFVFDFPTHAANGRFESIYWGAEPSKREKFFIGPPIFGRNNGDGTVYAKQNLYKEKYWSIINIFYSGGSSGYFRKALRFNDYNKGYALLDGTNTSATNSSYIQFPESLKGHQLYVPIDLSLDYYVDFTNAVKLLNSSGGAFISNELHDVVPVYKENGEIDYFVGVYIYYSSPNYYLKIYKWSNVGVLLSIVGPINLTTNFKDAYNSNFNYITYTINPLMSGEGYIEIYGYNSRTDTQYNETVYTNRLLRLDINGNLTSELNLKPKIGSSTWFASKGMNSGNIERRCYLSNLNYRTKNRIYLYYSGTQGGTGFYQVITHEGNLVEAYREYFTFEDYSDSTAYPIIGTDKSVSMYRYSYNDYVYFGIYHLSLSKPCGAHTKLAQPVEKTDANTMKIQYTFEIDLIDFSYDYY
ncbi:hypothetical protein [Caloramator proteoclasticus]|uniref:Uncharacterized protein n=1 Tax=Caloramator proteoclasticus DSM 10124 TaxID=1121262 RepID=A0A1M5ATE5_9CLOT|nr:hypothetical protein [Caloramator proteoclasticus]SHF33509.1 hypothetical protein SAMN02746091_02286 [Caloramator proteoclasticus DSM 10124]